MCTAVGLLGRVSLCEDVLGFAGGKVPARLNTARSIPQVSLRAHAQRLQGRWFDLWLILAGSDLMTTVDEDVVDYAVWRMREIYAPAGITVRRARRQPVLASDALGHDSVTTAAEIIDTGHDLTVDGIALPVVLPAAMNVTTVNPDGTISVTLGRSPIKGECGDRDAAGQNSAVVMINGEETARTLSHEVGHFLGCEHPGTAGTNLMAQTGAASKANGGDAFGAVTIVAGDRAKMRDHCTVRDGLSGFGDERSYDPASYTVDELMAAARGESRLLAGTLAVDLLAAKLGARAQEALEGLAQDEAVDLRSRRTAVLALSGFPTAAPVLEELVASAPDLVARAARVALDSQE
jgi:hypothetical protein